MTKATRSALSADTGRLSHSWRVQGSNLRRHKPTDLQRATRNALTSANVPLPWHAGTSSGRESEKPVLAWCLPRGTLRGLPHTGSCSGGPPGPERQKSTGVSAPSDFWPMHGSSQPVRDAVRHAIAASSYLDDQAEFSRRGWPAVVEGAIIMATTPEFIEPEENDDNAVLDDITLDIGGDRAPRRHQLRQHAGSTDAREGPERSGQGRSRVAGQRPGCGLSARPRPRRDQSCRRCGHAQEQPRHQRGRRRERSEHASEPRVAHRNVPGDPAARPGHGVRPTAAAGQGPAGRRRHDRAGHHHHVRRPRPPERDHQGDRPADPDDRSGLRSVDPREAGVAAHPHARGAPGVHRRQRAVPGPDGP